jgi:DUF2993 family protein
VSAREEPALSITQAPVRRTRWRPLVIVLLVVVVLLLVIDRIALLVVERAGAKTLQESQHLDRTPSVSVAGFPFLTQLIAGHFGKVRLTAADVTVGEGGRTVRIKKVTAHLHGVSVPRDMGTVRADSATATGLVSYADLSATLGVPLSYAGPSADGVGRTVAHTTPVVAGQQLSGSVTAEVAIEDGALRFISPRISVDGAGGADVPQPAVDALSSVYGQPIPLTHLPFGLRARSVSARPDGVRFTLTARNLTFHRS